jgi:hypothetical protein
MSADVSDLLQEAAGCWAKDAFEHATNLAVSAESEYDLELAAASNEVATSLFTLLRLARDRRSSVRFR